MSKAISRRDFLKVSGAVGAAGLLAACGGSGNAGSTATSTAASSAAASVAGLSSDPVTLTMSWWGGESRHNAYQEALKAFSAEHTTHHRQPHLCCMVRLGGHHVHQVCRRRG